MLSFDANKIVMLSFATNKIVMCCLLALVRE